MLDRLQAEGTATKNPEADAFLAENGIFAKSRDPADLAAKIVRVLINDEMAITIGRANRKRVSERFTWAINSEVLLQVYRRAIQV